jgi:alpha-galactosidase
LPLASDRIVNLRAAGVSLVVDLRPPVPVVLHWGADLGPLSESAKEALSATRGTAQLDNAPDEPREFSLLPTEFEGWSGVPAIAGHRAGAATTPRPRTISATVDARDDEGGQIDVHLLDDVSQLTLHLTIRLTAAGIVELQTTATAQGARGAGAPYDLAGLVAMVPVPARATDVLDLTGKWSRERSPQRGHVRDGLHARQVRRGKPGVDSPYVLCVGTPAFGSRSGEIWAMHVAWSGDQQWFVERLHEGAGAFSAVLGGGELLRPGEVRLMPGESYESPRVLFTWSDHGLDGIADRFHVQLRAGHPRSSPQPLVLNTWEAVYFDHDLSRLFALVERAAVIGVERIVLDDGWFRGRRNDRSGLGDWQIDDDVWPDGLGPLVDQVRSRGMGFGLWVEPEMVNLDSTLARQHPEWILGPTPGLGASARHQYVLDIAHPKAFDYLLTSISSLVELYSIDFLKWDHNRDLHEAVHRDPDGDRPGVRDQTLAFYALLDELRRRHPALEIESCAAGGGRVDFGVLERTDRIWTSDCNDPIERQSIQRWTEMLVPPEYIGAHIGAARSHTTGRASDAPFRLVTTLFGSAGIESDVTRCTQVELDQLVRWAALYKEFRGLVQSGRRVHADLADTQTLLSGSVAEDASTALFSWVRLATSAPGQAGRVPFPGLDPARDYEIRVRDDLGMPSVHQAAGPEWLDKARSLPLAVPGVILATVGIPLPTLNPGQALLLELRAL